MDFLTPEGRVAALHAIRDRLIGAASATVYVVPFESTSPNLAPGINRVACDKLPFAIPFIDGELDGRPCRLIDLDALKARGMNSKAHSQRLRALLDGDRWKDGR